MAVCAIAIGSVFLGNTGVLRAQSVETMVEICNTQQERIDLIDGKKDSMVLFNTMAQNVRGKKIFFETVDRFNKI